MAEHCRKCYGCFCRCNDEQPAPVRLSPEMLGEADRRELTSLLSAAKYYVESNVGKTFVPSYIQWADRLLNNHGEG